MAPSAQRTSLLTRIVQVIFFAVIIVVGGGGLLVGIGAAVGTENIAKLFPGGQIPMGVPFLSQLAPVNFRTPGLWLSNDGAANGRAVMRCTLLHVGALVRGNFVFQPQIAAPIAVVVKDLPKAVGVGWTIRTKRERQNHRSAK